MPDPHCAACNGTFVEKMENPEDDPREYQQHMPGAFEDDGRPPGIDSLFRLLGIHHQMEHARPQGSTPERLSPGGFGPRTRVEFTGGRNGGTRVIRVGGPNTLDRPSHNTSSEVPTMSQYLRRGPEPTTHGAPDRAAISGPMMAQYLMALLGAQRLGRMRGGGSLGGDPYAELLFGGLGAHEGEGGNGRWGDYVFNQQALDEIVTQLMESANSGRPVPATDEIIKDLPREVLEHGSSRLQQDCAVCKEQFKLETDDPDEQVVLILPCTHPFHEGCILPWIKSSGTCPVCRYALVPQPGHESPGPGPAGGSGSPPNTSSSGPPPRSPGAGNADAGGLFSSVFNSMGSGRSSGGSGRPRTTTTTRYRSYPDPNQRSSSRRQNGSGNERDFPGAWGEFE